MFSIKTIQNLSLDVVSGSCCMAYFVSLLFNTQITFTTYIVLGLSVWLLYALDHLLDANEIGSDAHTIRHQFFHRYQKTIWIFWISCSLLNVILIFLYLEKPILNFGLLLSLPVIAHFLSVKLLFFNRFPFLQKEMSVAFAFSAAVVLPTLAISEMFISMKGTAIWLSIFLIAFQNLLLFSLFDLKNDTSQEQKSFVTKNGKKTTFRLLDFLFLLNTFILLYLSFETSLSHLIFFVLLQITMSLLRFNKVYFGHNERYRWFGDLVFSVPILFLFL